MSRTCLVPITRAVFSHDEQADGPRMRTRAWKWYMFYLWSVRTMVR